MRFTHTDLLTFCFGPFKFVQHAVVMHSTHHFLTHQSKLLARGQLPLAREAGETRQVVNVSLCPAHPVSGANGLPTTRAQRPIPPVNQHD